MKKFLSVLAVLSLSLAVGRCDFSEDDGDVTDDDTYVEPTDSITEEDVPVVGPCEVGQSGGWYVVRISDDLTNPSLIEGEGLNCQGKNPGADIDAITIYRGDEVVSYAESVLDFEPWVDATCDNVKDNPDEVLDAPNGVAAGENFTGYFSLNGGKIIVAFEEDAELLCGDTIEVVEMDSGNPGSVEKYIVDFGASAEGPWTLGATNAVGEFDVEVSWDW